MKSREIFKSAASRHFQIQMGSEATHLSYSQNLQQLPIKRTTKDFLKVLLRNTFKKSFGSGLSAKRCNS